jgi:hypothetical protein
MNVDLKMGSELLTGEFITLIGAQLVARGARSRAGKLAAFLGATID